MSKINGLIKELCPNGVEYKNIKDICVENFWVMPSTPKYQDNGVPYITSKNIRNGKVLFSDIKYITEDDYKVISSNRPIKENDFLISMIGTIGEVGIVKDIDLPFYGQNMYLLRLNTEVMNIRFFYHYFTSEKVRNKLLGEKNNGNQGYLKTKNIEMLNIPIPPIEVQEEIVRILDRFGELEEKLEEELEEELEARRSQYEFWRGKLLRKKNTEFKLQDILTIRNGKDYKKLNYGNIPVYGSGGIMTYVNNFIYDKPSVLIPRKGSLGNVFYVDTPFWNVDTIYYTEIDENKALPKYIYYFIQNKHLDRLNIAGGVPSMTQATLNKLDIQLPSLEEQEKIVKILDEFVELTTEMSVGLSAEIESRKKQYEYYKNKLLSFKELIVDINDIKTYPSEFIKFVQENEIQLNNTFNFKTISMDCDCFLFETINDIFNNYYFKCIHASRVNDIDDIYNNGILLPANSDELINIMLTPIKNILNQKYEKVENMLRDNIKNRKYQTLHYVVGDIKDITISNGFLMLNKYGGELLEDTILFSEPDLYNKIANFGKPVAVLFKLSNKQIRTEFLTEIYSFMLEKLLYSTKSHFFHQTWSFKSIEPDKIIEVKELVNYD